MGEGGDHARVVGVCGGEIAGSATCDLEGLGVGGEFSREEGGVDGVYAEVFQVTGCGDVEGRHECRVR